MSLFDEYNWEYTDECLLKMFEARSKSFNKKEAPLQIFAYDNAYVLPIKPNPIDFFNGGLYDSNLQYILESRLLPNRIVKGYDFDVSDAIFDDREVVFAGFFWEHWGHFILEQVSRLWYFLKEKDDSLPIIYSSPRPLSGNYLEFFELLGIDTSRLVWVNCLTKFKKIILPEVSMVASKYYADEYGKIFQKVSSAVTKDESIPKKIFYTRRNFHKSKVKDHGMIHEIECFFEKNGYTLVSPENLSLKNQVAMLKSCQKLVAVAGSLPHNLLFADKDIDVVILNKSYAINNHQFLIDSVTGIRPLYVDAQLSILPLHVGAGPFYFWFSENLIQYAKDNNMEYENYDNEKYLWDYIFYYLYRIPTLLKHFKANELSDEIKKVYFSRLKHPVVVQIISSLILSKKAIFLSKCRRLFMIISYKFGKF